MMKLVKEHQCALILVTHDLAVVSEVADRINVMYCGKIVESGTREDIMFNNAHPYTSGLIGSIPKIDQKQERLETIEGIVPNMFKLPKGCNFAPRCKRAEDICLVTEPNTITINGEHHVSCHNPLLGGK